MENIHATLLKGVERTALAHKLPSPVAARAAAAVAAATRMLDEEGLAGNSTNATNATVCVLCVCVGGGDATNAMNATVCCPCHILNDTTQSLCPVTLFGVICGPRCVL